MYDSCKLYQKQLYHYTTMFTISISCLYNVIWDYLYDEIKEHKALKLNQNMSNPCKNMVQFQMCFYRYEMYLHLRMPANWDREIKFLYHKSAIAQINDN